MKIDLTSIIGFIYKIVSPNGKIYIGQTINTKQRKRNYLSKGFKQQIKLWNNCNKYNWNPIETFEIIEECLCGPNREYLNKREKYWIQYYNSFENGLNCNKGGHGNIGHKHSNKTKQKMSNSAKKYSKEISDRMKKLQTGKKKSEDFKKKVSKKLTGLKRNNTFREKMSKIGKKRIMSEETKNKISLTKSGQIVPKKRKAVYQLDLNGEIIKLWECAGDAENDLKITRGKISDVCLGKRNITGGFKWIYKNEMD
jgi:group I intron endonuclease